jgi:hypothetical protein
VALAPWLTLSTAQLTEVAAFPACAWALLAMQRSLAAPSLRRDLLALVAIAVASYGRLQLILLAPVLVVAMLLHELGYGVAAGGDRRSRLREALGRMARRHALLSAAALAGLLAGVPLLLSGKLASAFGFYGGTLNGATFGLARSYVAFIALGLGALPAALAIGFAFESLLAPVLLALTLQVAEVSVRFNGATIQERYLFYIVPLLAVGMCASLLRRRSYTANGPQIRSSWPIIFRSHAESAHNQAMRHRKTPARQTGSTRCRQALPDDHRALLDDQSKSRKRKVPSDD